MKAKLIHKLTQFITQLNKYRKSNLNRQIVVKQNKPYERKDTERGTCKILPDMELYPNFFLRQNHPTLHLIRLFIYR